MEDKNDEGPKGTRIELDEECWVDRYMPGQLAAEAKFDGERFEELWAAHPKEYGKVRIHGREVATPRWQQTYLKSYTFTGMAHAPSPLPDILGDLFNWVRRINPAVNSCLVNWYKDGAHYIGPHSDDTRQLVPDSDIFSFSYGAERTFCVHRKPGGAIVSKIVMPHNSLLVMRGKMQARYKHSVPKTARSHGRRINVTFRCFQPSTESK